MVVTVKKQAHYSGSDIRSALCEHMTSFKATGIAITSVFAKKSKHIESVKNYGA